MYVLEDFVQNYNQYSDLARVNVHSHVSYQNQKYPLVSVHYGNPQAPTLLIVGGVHGLERVGAQLTLSLLNSFHERLSWDQVAKNFLKDVQLVFIPLVNPVGYFEVHRCNANGVDLMRNAPIEADTEVPFLLGGHKYSARLPWYRGTGVEQETQFAIDVVQNILKESNCLISVDIHSGFGFKDQIWFPYANSHNEFLQLTEFYMLFELFRKSFPYHIYQIEPQSKNYLTHGDIWDYCFHSIRKPEQVYLPLTLEMGSWMWVKKNPLQLFSKIGLFNPIKEHRLNRTLRRHRPLFDFLVHSLASSSVWSQPPLALAEQLRAVGRKQYYD